MKIVATDINNLTDARYFAAWGVEILGFNSNDVIEQNLSGQQIKEMIDWIEGPQSALTIDALSIDDSMLELITLLDVDHLIIGPFIEQSTVPQSIKNIIRKCTLENADLFDDDIIISIMEDFKSISPDVIDKINALSNKDRKVYLEMNISPIDLPQIFKLSIDGIILKGGEEEKVGFKSYDELDELFEWIEENEGLE